MHFGLASKDEARAYWAHPVLGPRLKACSEQVLAVEGKTAHQIFGSPDDLKFRSCMTLFNVVAPEEPVFGRALKKYFDGQWTSATAGKYRSVSYTRFNLPDSGLGLQGPSGAPKYTWQYDENHARIKVTRVNASATS